MPFTSSFSSRLFTIWTLASWKRHRMKRTWQWTFKRWSICCPRTSLSTISGTFAAMKLLQETQSTALICCSLPKKSQVWWLLHKLMELASAQVTIDSKCKFSALKFLQRRWWLRRPRKRHARWNASCWWRPWPRRHRSRRLRQPRLRSRIRPSTVQLADAQSKTSKGKFWEETVLRRRWRWGLAGFRVQPKCRWGWSLARHTGRYCYRRGDQLILEEKTRSCERVRRWARFLAGSGWWN